jgi:hypothetical protein
MAKKPTKMKAAKTRGRARAKAKAAPAIRKAGLRAKEGLRVEGV